MHHSVTLVVAAGKPKSALKQLSQLGLMHLHYFTLLSLTDCKLPHIMFNNGFIKDYTDNYNQYNNVYHALSDVHSKESYYRVLAFRFTLDLEYVSCFDDLQSEQYFEDFVREPSGSVFIDVGSYDGYTSLAYSRRYPEYKRIYAFEPDPANYTKTLDVLSSLPRTHSRNIGLSNRKSTMYLSQQNSQSSLSTCGTVSVGLDSLDNLGIEHVTLIKVDVEGHEEEVLMGAQRTIKRWKPGLAISSYHSPSQLFKIPQLALAYNSQYKLFFRHYTESLYESVFYMIQPPP